MGIQEKKSRKKARNRKIQEIVLKTVAAAGLLSVALLAPNALQMFKSLGYSPKPRQKEILNLSRKRLIDKGLLRYSKNGFLELTPKGEEKIHILEMADYKTKKPKKWDGKWRVIIFDIREKRKDLREKVRRTLEAIGFIHLQHSVWVYPYDCEDLITLLKADFKVGKDLLYLIVESIENDRHLRYRFDLV